MKRDMIPVTPEKAREFVARNHRAVLITRRADGRVQSSPVTVGLDGDGNVVMSSRETAAKVLNLRRDPRATFCVVTDPWYGDWVQIDGTAEIVSMPHALDGLIDYYRRISGEHPDWDDYRRAMHDERRVLVRTSIESAGPATLSG